MSAAIALDLGTTRIKAGLVSLSGAVDSIVSRRAPAILEQGGRFESDALAYAETVDEVLRVCLAMETLPLGMCSQRSSFLVWERANGCPVTPLISWQDTRGAASCEALSASASRIRELAGLPLTPYYLGPKLRMLMQELPQLRERLLAGEWLLGTLDTYLIWRWTGGREFVTDVSMAARTLLMDVRGLQWSQELCALFEVPISVLPRITASAGLGLKLDNGLTLQASMGDQSAALLATLGEGKHEAMVNLGTGGFVACYLPQGRTAPDGYLQTLLWQDGKGRLHQACEGTLNSIAAALKPYPDDACEPGKLALDDIFCLSEPSGLGAPYFRGDLGVRFSEPLDGLTPSRIAVLLQEGIIFRVARILEDFQREFGLERVFLAGGLSKQPCLQQGIADCSPCACYRLERADAGLAGAGLAAAGKDFCGSSGAERIMPGGAAARLAEKYARWKTWLDGLLAERSGR